MIQFIKSLFPKKLKKFVKKKVLKKGYVHKPVHIASLTKDEFTLNATIAYNKYGGYCTPYSAQKESVVQEILKGNVYEPETIQYIIDNCSDGDVVQAGAYFGDFLPGIAKHISKNAQVWTFEPSKEYYRCAQITILINDLANVNLFQVGLGAEKSQVQLQIETEDGRRLGGASRIIDSKSGKFVPINIETLDSMIPENRNISILQLDLEGFEIPALKGAINTIKRCKPILILEILSHNDILSNDWFKQNILSLGYEITGKVHNNTIVKIQHNK
ncbi:FkbM family methyltransferase [Kordia algicida OT-1]|uniref:Arginyl-tRNA synthetase n=1 Tax=Kordia algicida OT-1 TaxID=391587 RepID=A9DIP4_9FLAO|nr:FkbM family methyltransferase [Kordia algicida]EDP97946.1 arginyl-tRNA synthetase [Kordia algicida OT-1]